MPAKPTLLSKIVFFKLKASGPSYFSPLLNLRTSNHAPFHDRPNRFSIEWDFERRAWALLPDSFQKLVESLISDGRTEFGALGRPITLAEGIVLEACLGAAAASAVIQKLRGVETGRSADSLRKSLTCLLKTPEAVLRLANQCEAGSVVEYLLTDLDSKSRPKPKRKSRAKVRGAPPPLRKHASKQEPGVHRF